MEIPKINLGIPWNSWELHRIFAHLQDSEHEATGRPRRSDWARNTKCDTKCSFDSALWTKRTSMPSLHEKEQMLMTWSHRNELIKQQAAHNVLVDSQEIVDNYCECLEQVNILENWSLASHVKRPMSRSRNRAASFFDQTSIALYKDTCGEALL